MLVKQLKMKEKRTWGCFFGILLGDFGTTLLGNIWSGLTRKGVIRTGEGTLRFDEDFLMLLHPLTKFEIQRCYQNDHWFINLLYQRVRQI